MWKKYKLLLVDSKAIMISNFCLYSATNNSMSISLEWATVSMPWKNTMKKFVPCIMLKILCLLLTIMKLWKKSFLTDYQNWTKDARFESTLLINYSIMWPVNLSFWQKVIWDWSMISLKNWLQLPSMNNSLILSKKSASKIFRSASRSTLLIPFSVEWKNPKMASFKKCPSPNSFSFAGSAKFSKIKIHFTLVKKGLCLALLELVQMLACFAPKSGSNNGLINSNATIWSKLMIKKIQSG